MPHKYRGVAEWLHLHARWGWLVKAIPWPFLPGKKTLVSIVQDKHAPGLVWMAVETRKSLGPTGI